MRTSNFFSSRTLGARRGRRASFALACSVALALPLAGGLLSGCGSGSDGTTGFVQGGGGGANFGSRSYTANAVTLRGDQALAGKTATLALTTDATGGASGTLTIDDPASTTRVVIATPAVSGSYDPQTGALSLSGSFTINGVAYPFNISGTLPPAGGAGSLTYNINGETYSTSFVIPAGGGGGGTTGGTTGGQTQNGSFEGTINNNGGANVSGGGVSIASAAGGTFTNGGALGVSFVQNTGAGAKNLSVTSLGSVNVGQDITVGPDTIAVIYNETSVNTSTFATTIKYFMGVGGTVKVLSASGGVIKVQLSNVRMSVDSSQAVGTGTGSFLLSGTATVNGATIR